MPVDPHGALPAHYRPHFCAPQSTHDSRERPRYHRPGTPERERSGERAPHGSKRRAEPIPHSAGPNLTPHQNNTRNAVQVVLDFASGPRLPRRRRVPKRCPACSTDDAPPASLLRSPSQPASALRMAGADCLRMARTSPPARPAHLTAAPASSLDPPAAPYPSPGPQAMWYTNSDHHHWYTNSDHHHWCALRRTCKPPNR